MSRYSSLGSLQGITKDKYKKRRSELCKKYSVLPRANFASKEVVEDDFDFLLSSEIQKGNNKDFKDLTVDERNDLNETLKRKAEKNGRGLLFDVRCVR